MASPKTAVEIVFGAMTLGKEGAEQVRVHSPSEASKILDVFQKHGHNEIDTAIVYGGGSSELMLGQLDWQSRSFIMDTKFSPRTDLRGPGSGSNHSPADLRLALHTSLASLKTEKVDMWYLHAPDRTTPYIDTLREVNNLHKAGYFKRFGISNYAAWEVAQIVEICDRNGWIKPTAYQGVYNALHRLVEPELFPCLRYYGISFYEFNPLGGGFLTSRYTRDSTASATTATGGVKGGIEAGSRFDPNRKQGQNYRARYWQPEYFDALEILRAALKGTGISEAEASLRWISHHSLLDRGRGDKIIIGASSAQQLEENLANLEKGPLPKEVLDAFEEGWKRVKGISKSYFH